MTLLTLINEVPEDILKSLDYVCFKSYVTGHTPLVSLAFDNNDKSCSNRICITDLKFTIFLKYCVKGSFCRQKVPFLEEIEKNPSHSSFLQCFPSCFPLMSSFFSFP